MRSKILVFQLAYPLTYHLLSIKPVSFLLPRFYIYHWPLRFLNHDYICFKFSEDVFDRGTLPEARLTIYVPWYNLHWTTCVALVPSSSFSFPWFFLVSLCIWLHFSFFCKHYCKDNCICYFFHWYFLVLSGLSRFRRSRSGIGTGMASSSPEKWGNGTRLFRAETVSGKRREPETKEEPGSEEVSKLS